MLYIKNSLIFFIFILVFHINSIKSQTDVFPIIFIEKNNWKRPADTITLYHNSTFKYDHCFLNFSQKEHEVTRGTYSLSDSFLVIRSYIEYKRVLKVNEVSQLYNKRIYEWSDDTSSVYFGVWGYIIELDNENKQFSDTLFFFGFDDFKLESKHKDAKGFELFLRNEYVGEYYFKNEKSNLIKIWFSESGYDDRPDIFYINERHFLLRENELIQIGETDGNSKLFYKKN